MSDFNWDDHPIVPAGTQSAQQAQTTQASAAPGTVGSFSWNDHPVVQASANPSPSDSGNSWLGPRFPNDTEAEKQIRANINKINDSDTAENNAIADSVVMGHLAHIKAKLGQILSGEGVANDENYIKRRDDAIAEQKDLAEKYPRSTREGKVVGLIAPMLLSNGLGPLAKGLGAASLGAEAAEGAGAAGELGAASSKLGTPLISEAGEPGQFALNAGRGGPELQDAEQITGASEAAAPGAQAAGQTAAESATPAGKTLVQRAQAAGKGALIGAAMGAAQNPGDEPGKVDSIQAGPRFENAERGAATGAVIGTAADAIPETADALKKYSQAKAFKAAGGMLKDFRKAYANDSVEKTGQFVLDNKLVQAGDTYSDVADKADKLRSDTGEQLGNGYAAANAVIKKVNPEAAAKIDEAGFNPVRDKKAIMSAVKSDLGYAYKADPALQGISDYIDKLADQHGNVTLNPQTTNEIKTSLDKTAINWERNPLTREPDQETALKTLRGYLNDKVKGQVQAVGEQIGDPAAAKSLTDLNQKYGTSASVARMAGDKANREAANQSMGLGEKITGGTGAIIGADIGEKIAGAPGAAIGAVTVGAGGAIANKLARKFGNQATASIGNKFSGVLANMPEVTAIQQANPALYQALAKKIPTDGQRSAPSEEPSKPLKGEAKWTDVGYKNVAKHVDGNIPSKAVLTANPKVRELLQQASDAKPGSKRMQIIVNQIKDETDENGENDGEDD